MNQPACKVEKSLEPIAGEKMPDGVTVEPKNKGKTTADMQEDDTGPPPKAFFPKKSFSAGEVEQGAEITHTYIVKNQGPGILKVISAKPS